MIVVQVADPSLRRAVVRAVHVEEDVFVGRRIASAAIERGFPRLVVRYKGEAGSSLPPEMPLLEIDGLMLGRWESEWVAFGCPIVRSEYLTERLRVLLDRAGTDATWVDRSLADLTKAAGAQLPPPLRSFARRVLEFPVHYTTLHTLADAYGMSRGALKARFRRRGLSSPATYLRWFRIMAVARLLSDESVTVAAAAERLGFTSSGNLCRMMSTVAEMTPTEAKTSSGWNRIVISIARVHLSPKLLEAWVSFGELLERRAA